MTQDSQTVTQADTVSFDDCPYGGTCPMQVCRDAGHCISVHREGVVTQKCRDYAADLILPRLMGTEQDVAWIAEIRAGKRDDIPGVQAFARFERDIRASTPAAPDAVRDWWKPEPEDPFWMLEAEDGEWLKNADSLLGTRDPAKAIRFPNKEAAELHPARMKAGTKWWSAKPTEHAWVAALAEQAPISAGDDGLREALEQIELQSTNIAGDFDTDPWRFVCALHDIAAKSLAATPSPDSSPADDVAEDDWFKRNADRTNPKAFINTDPEYFASECADAIFTGALSRRSPPEALEAKAKALARADGYDWEPKCGEETCEDARCIGNGDPDHVPEAVRNEYRRRAEALAAAPDHE